MKIIQLTLILLLLVAISKGQGIQFELGDSWDQIKEKAKRENKLIFVDCYATWCGPCKQMDKEVYPSQKVGDYFNKRFISVKLQMDRTSGDASEIKDRYAMADTLKKKMQIEGYPTFLFLTADGQLLHKGLGYRSVGGLIMMASDVIGTLVTDSATQHEQKNELAKVSEVSASYPSARQLQEAFGKKGVVDYGSDTSWLNRAKAIDDKYRNSPMKPEDGQAGNIWILNTSAWNAFEECNDDAILNRALAWSEVSIALCKILADEKREPINVQLLDTRANLLHKLGRTAEAIVQEEEAIAIDKAMAEKMGKDKGFFADSYLKTLAKMKAGQATWPE